mmetsp:Transcript_8875/g.22877  ORF Transcript_8875/g.22877 Transcript_8875/m.22877 type:complete len:98 (+) Transcript_8875:522-815(+)
MLTGVVERLTTASTLGAVLCPRVYTARINVASESECIGESPKWHARWSAKVVKACTHKFCSSRRTSSIDADERFDEVGEVAIFLHQNVYLRQHLLWG